MVSSYILHNFDTIIIILAIIITIIALIVSIIIIIIVVIIIVLIDTTPNSTLVIRIQRKIPISTPRVVFIIVIIIVVILRGDIVSSMRGGFHDVKICIVCFSVAARVCGLYDMLYGTYYI